MRTVVARGHQFELFTYDEGIVTPSWVVRREAREILPSSHVMTYQHGSGAGSPALHANLFRYEMMHQLGDWWIDLDVLLMHPDLPNTLTFYANDPRGVIVNAILKFPRGDALLYDAIRYSRAVGEKTAQWGQTGPQLITELVKSYGLEHRIHPWWTVNPLDFFETEAFFDPSRFDEVKERCSNSPFIHTFHELRRSSGFAHEAGPPKGSFLDWMFETHEVEVQFPYRVEYQHVKRWFGNQIDFNTYKTLYEEQDRANRELAAIRNSRSWKITKPLRDVLDYLRRLRQ